MIFQTSIFEVPFFKTKAIHHKEIKSYFEKTVFPFVQETQPNNPNLNLWSDYFPNIPKIDPNIKELYYDDAEKFKVKAGYTNLINWDTDVKVWYNVGVRGTSQEEHDHMGGFPPISWSAIHYAVFDPQEHEATMFFNPLHQMFLKSTQPTRKEDVLPPEWCKKMVMPEVEEGDMIIFPSYLRHCVSMQTSDKLRATVALNFSITEK